MALVMKQMGW